MSEHYIKRCSCGVVLEQCRCPGPKVEYVSSDPCAHRPVSEHAKERLVVSSSFLICDKEARMVANCQPFMIPGLALTNLEAVKVTKDLVESYNACLNMANPEADVKALVEALEVVCDELHGIIKSEFETPRNPFPERYNVPLQRAKALLARLRREP